MTSTSAQDRLRGCIIGGALGDAIGLSTEFMSAKSAIRIYGTNLRFALRPPAPEGYTTMIMDNHRATFPEAGWTDDTDQSLLILMSFLQNGDIDPKDFARRLRYWVQYGFRALDRLPFDVGITIGRVVRSEGYVDNPRERAREIWDNGGRVMAANGAVMRDPVIGAVLYNKDMDKIYEASIGVAEMTHADPRCLVSCTIASALVAEIIKNNVNSEEDIRQIIERAIEPVKAHDPPLSSQQIEELHGLIWQDSLSALKLDQSNSIGYTYKCIASGVWALRQGLKARDNATITGVGERARLAQAFERIITELTMAAGDADTNAAVAGSLLGAFYGYSNLPQQWVKDLAHEDWLSTKADATYKLTTGDGENDRREDSDSLIDGGKGDMSQGELGKAWSDLTREIERRCAAT